MLKKSFHILYKQATNVSLFTPYQMANTAAEISRILTHLIETILPW